MPAPNLIVTTPHKGGCEQEALALYFSQELGISFVPRQKLSLPQLVKKYNVSGVLVANPEKAFYYTQGQEFFFHPNMAAVRIKELRSGKTDQMINAMKLETGMSVLDCTLGFGADSIVASYAVGMTGNVVGLEVSPVIASLVGYGLKKYSIKSKHVAEAMKNITVINVEHHEYLMQLDTDCYDVVYFDPMFRNPKLDSSSLAPLRALADHSPLTRETLNEALRVAKKRVVFKERSTSHEFARLGIEMLVGGKNAPVAYGVICKRGI